MRIDNEFTVAAPLDRVWDLFTDVEELAPCLPGAELTEVDGDVYSGRVKVKVGPVVAAYRGTARFVEQDPQAHRAVVDASGRADRGAGNASATVTVRLRETDGGTTATVVTDLRITGKLAQLGGGMIKDVSERLLGQFVERVEARLASPDHEEADGMADDEGRGDGRRSANSHMGGGTHMSGGSHMGGGAHMSGGDHMAGDGPLSGEREDGDAGGDDGDPAPADPGPVPAERAPTVPEPRDGNRNETARAASTRRTIDGPAAEPVDLMAVSGGNRFLWPTIAVVVAFALGFLVGYAVLG
ncbi:SRPBCC family protein [Nocardiopsis sp. MG754419]|uniref:SRPBCC family protein n=1 Tax=Nocardiopsis sp. MG754419 TaxID=2259865 RepID=UPI001BA4E65E|nr:SRPBCC family protein [Nocardiopsis sp. MG754419]MBR8744846.1 carbon monoxide dehydrogenase [Nocardiopsis sp. MG754419]